MLEDQQDIGFQIADAQRERGSRRSLAFPEGVSSHTKIAAPDAVESNAMKVAEVETPPGIKFADVKDCPPGSKIADVKPSLGTRVARPPMLSLTGDFRLPIKLSGEDSKSRQSIGLKLSTMNPGLRLGRRR